MRLVFPTPLSPRIMTFNSTRPIINLRYSWEGKKCEEVRGVGERRRRRWSAGMVAVAERER
jgi:hypothetical protein